MSSVSEQLLKLKQVKENIAQAIVNQGVTVLKTDTFNSYADKILTIETGEGTIIHVDVPQIPLSYEI